MIVLYLLVLMVVRLVSYNSHGLGPAKLDYIAKLCSLYDFVLVQEHWFLEQTLAIFSDQISGTCCHGVSAVDSSILLQGRTHGGCSILWSSSLTCKVTPVESDSRAILCEIWHFWQNFKLEIHLK